MVLTETSGFVPEAHILILLAGIIILLIVRTRLEHAAGSFHPDTWSVLSKGPAVILGSILRAFLLKDAS